MRIPKSTKRWTDWWRNRVCDWQQAYGSTTDHPHRELIVNAIKERGKPITILEGGCATAPNLVCILKKFPDVKVGGFDVSPSAVSIAAQTIPSGHFLESDITNFFYSTKCTSVFLTDACLIYVGKEKIKSVLKEIARITYDYVVFCEFHSTSWLERLGLKLTSGYNAHNYQKLLQSAGYFDIQIKKIPKATWPGMPWERFGYIISARCPR
jgi:ubiquinone/menaquinone biosynthesis C-methylase UbiE